MSDIFISYSSEDKNRVKSLAYALERKGWSVWWDRRIPAGKSFDEIIHEALKAAKSVVVVWTKTSVKSTWVKNESRSGLRRGILFPVMLLDEVEIPLEFEHLQAAHLMDWQPEQEHPGFDQFIDDIGQLIGIPTTSVIQQPPVTQSQEPPPAPSNPTPEPDREPPPQHTDDVEPAGGQLDEQPSTPDTIARVVSADVPTDPVGTDEEPPAASSPPTPGREMAARSRKSKRRGTGPRSTGTKQPIAETRAVAQDSTGEPVVSPEPTEGAELIHTDQSAGADYSDYPTHPVVSTSPFSFLPIGLGLLAAIGALAYFLIFSKSPSPQYQPTTQSMSSRTEVAPPSAVRESITQPSAATTQKKPAVKQESAAGETVATKPSPTASPTKDVTSKGSQLRQKGISKLSNDSASTQNPLLSTETTSSERKETVDASTIVAEPPSVADPALAFTGKDDRAPMVMVLAGQFMMGSREDNKMAGNDEQPAHPVYLDAYYIDQYEVTNSRYAKFLEETKWPGGMSGDVQYLKQYERQPVRWVSWNDARAYCAWAGKRLPTEAEWEKAARGTDERLYPWGNEGPGGSLGRFAFGYYTEPAQVGMFEGGKSPYGVYDMAGNVWEWTADRYDERYYSKSPERNPKGPSNGLFRVRRGGSFSTGPGNLLSASRQKVSPSIAQWDTGFRCAKEAPSF